MTDSTPARYDEAGLFAADEATLERRRWTLVRADDDRRQVLIDHLMVRAMPIVARTTVRLGDAARLPRASILGAGEEAAITLLMRLHTADPLPGISELARTVAATAVRAHAPLRPEAQEPAAPPRLDPPDPFAAPERTHLDAPDPFAAPERPRPDAPDPFAAPDRPHLDPPDPFAAPERPRPDAPDPFAASERPRLRVLPGGAA